MTTKEQLLDLGAKSWIKFKYTCAYLRLKALELSLGVVTWLLRKIEDSLGVADNLELDSSDDDNNESQSCSEPEQPKGDAGAKKTD